MCVRRFAHRRVTDTPRRNHCTLSICHLHHGEETLDRLQCRLRNQSWSEWRTCPWSAAVHQSVTCDASSLRLLAKHSYPMRPPPALETEDIYCTESAQSWCLKCGYSLEHIILITIDNKHAFKGLVEPFLAFIKLVLSTTTNKINVNSSMSVCFDCEKLASSLRWIWVSAYEENLVDASEKDGLMWEPLYGATCPTPKSLHKGKDFRGKGLFYAGMSGFTSAFTTTDFTTLFITAIQVLEHTSTVKDVEGGQQPNKMFSPGNALGPPTWWILPWQWRLSKHNWLRWSIKQEENRKFLKKTFHRWGFFSLFFFEFLFLNIGATQNHIQSPVMLLWIFTLKY